MHETALSDRIDGRADAPVHPDGEAVYLFAFADRDRVGRLPGFSDIPNPPPLLHQVGAITAVIGLVSLADFSGPAGERNLTDLEWLAPRVRDHGVVLQRLMQRSPVFPAPFGTLYTGFASLTAFMRRHEATLAAFLDAVSDTEEWGLKATARLATREVLESLACRAWPEWAALSPGTRYLRLCRERAALLDLGRARARGFVADLLDGLRPFVIEQRQLPGRAAPDDSGTESIGSYAMLVRSGDIAAISGRIAALRDGAAEHHVVLALTGPWPPFSFRPSLQG